MSPEQREKMVAAVLVAMRQKLDENTATRRRLYPELPALAEAAVDALGIERCGVAYPFVEDDVPVFRVGVLGDTDQ